MLISPPFLTAAQTDDDDFIDACMVNPNNEGLFPLGHYLSWHNGLHLQAPIDAQGQYLPVRCIADGEVIYSREGRDANNDINDPQNYSPWGLETQTPEWSDNGIVIVKHRTEIGFGDVAINESNWSTVSTTTGAFINSSATSNATRSTETALEFYSVYMHLQKDSRQSLPSVGKKIYRKDVIGYPGGIYGNFGQIHFEICLDQENLESLLGARHSSGWTTPGYRDPREVPTANGRTDAVFGSVYIYLPAQTPIRLESPLSHLQDTSSSTLGKAQWVEIAYIKGTTFFRSYGLDGQRISATHRERDGEYKLYQEANTRHTSISTSEQSRSSPSGWYELLRFGRNMGIDTLPAHAAHWRQIPTNNGLVWADLNAEGTHKFSDADFLPVMGWNCYDDDNSPSDQRCDSLKLKVLIRDPDPDNDQRMTEESLEQRRTRDDVKAQCRRVIARFPTEWDQATIDARWSWVKEEKDYQDNPDNWTRLQAHLQAITLPDLPQAYKDAQWHVHPKEFIRVMRRCGWLSEKEFKQLLPRAALRTGTYKDALGAKHPGTFWESIQTDVTDSNSVAQAHRIPLNNAMRKYGINTPMRQVGFFGNAMQETSWLAALAEGYRNTLWYDPWFGRGFLQLTSPGNYVGYWRWRGRSFDVELEDRLNAAYKTMYNDEKKRPDRLLKDALFPDVTQQIIEWRSDVGDPDRVRRDLLSPSDSAGYYWVKLMIRHADSPHELKRVQVNVVDDKGKPKGSKVYYRSPAFWKVAASVNLPNAIGRTDYRGLNGFDSRCAAYAVALAVLTENRFPDASDALTLEEPDNYPLRKDR